MFHYLKAGRPFGPVSGRDLQALLDGGVLGPDDEVRPEGETEWRSAREVVERIRAGEFVDTRDPGSARPLGAYTVYTSLSPPAAAPAPEPVSPTGTRCADCGTVASEAASFCRRCGRALARLRCPACARANPTDASFCEGCGARLSP